MAEYIKKKHAIEVFKDGCGLCGEEIQNIQGIEIVFCIECKYFDSRKQVCVHHAGLIEPIGDGFCNYGKEKQ